MDSVHELPAKLVKEILTGEFMELSKLLPKNFNVLNPSQDEPITLTLENSVIKVNKAKATSITDITEWTTAFTAYMGVIISKFPHRASELLEYMSLIRYAAKYHRGLGWCVYDIKFRQKAAANKSLKWSTIDSQLWLKTFTVAPSLLKEDIGVFQSGPSSTSTSRGTENRTCHNFNRGVPCARTPASMPTNVTGLGAGRIIPGSSAPVPMVQKRSSPQGWESQTPSTKAAATETSSFGGVVTPVNVVKLYQALSNHPEREFVKKLCSELREGARIGYSGPRRPRFSNNLPTAYLNPELVTGNLADEVAKGRTMGPFPTPPPPLKIFRFPLLVLLPKLILTNSEQYSIYPSQSLRPQASTISLKRMISPCSILLLTMPLQQFRNLAQAATWAKQTSNLLFGSFRSIWMTGNYWGCVGMGSIILTKPSHSGFALPRTFLFSCQMPLSGFYLTNVPSPLCATFWMIFL